MQIVSSTIAAAFQQHKWRYAKRERAWDVGYHLDLWQRSENAFTKNSFVDFKYLYDQMRRQWKAFRRGQARLSERKSFARLQSLDTKWRKFQLRDLRMGHVVEVWQLLESVKDLKQNKYGPSVVAISKFLHFWNPRLFVIVDDGVIWNWVLNHNWLWDEVKALRTKTNALLGDKLEKRNGNGCDLGSYLAILVWAAELLRKNESISSEFWKYVASYGEDPSRSIRDYDAAAVEWFLLGLVELPPVGVTLETTPK